MPSSLVHGAVLTTLLCVSPCARAAGLSYDVEMLRPGLGPAPGMETARVLPPRAVTTGLLVNSASRSVVLMTAEGERAGIPVDTRVAVHAVTRVGLGGRVEVSGALPLVWQEGVGDVGAADGLWLGDLELAGRVAVVAWKHFALAPRVELALPTGAEQAWIGEGTVRPGGGLAAEVPLFGPLRLLGDVAVRWHPARDPMHGLSRGSMLHLGGGARLDAGRASVAVVLLSRTFLGEGEAEDGSEILASLGGGADERFRVESVFGAGLRGGVGVPTWRVGLGARRSFGPREPSAIALYVGPPAEIELERIPEAPEAPPQTAARVDRDQIVVDDPVNFVFGEATLLPESGPTLAAVAHLLGGEPRIAYVVIEGHASEEGSFVYNYDLSQARARAVMHALVEAGVDPRRLGSRAYGEVAPARLGEEGLPANRRVVFRIVSVLPPEATPPAWDPTLRPWAEEAP